MQNGLSQSPLVVVGLGNPGTKYTATRHNLGFLVVDSLTKHWKCDLFHQKFQGDLAETVRNERKIFILKPRTFMNLSGSSVAQLVKFYKVDVSKNLIVVYDDLDLPPATLRIRLGGGAGGHNGVTSIIQSLGTEDFPRIRIGIGRSKSIPGDVYVLSKLSKKEQALFLKTIKICVEAIETVVTDGIERAMNVFNRKEEAK